VLQLFFWTRLTSEPSKRAAVPRRSGLRQEMPWAGRGLAGGVFCGRRVARTEQVLRVEQALLTANHHLLTDNHLFVFPSVSRGGKEV